MKKEDAIGCLQLIGFIIVIGFISYFIVKTIPKHQKSQEEMCVEKSGIPVFKNEMRYRGFPPGAWKEKVFYRCE